MVTHFIIALNLGVFVAMAILTSTRPELADRVEQWGAVWGLRFHVHQLVTSAFFHAGFMHIFGNMIFLLVFGPPVEDRFGRIGFSFFYLAGAMASGLAHIAVSNHPAIGASGAVAAVSGAFLVLFPRTSIKCFVFFIFVGIFAIPSWWLIGMFIILDLVAQVFSAENDIANMAHLGGYGMGISVAFLLLITGILKREPYDMFSILKHRHRRRAFASAHNEFVASSRVLSSSPKKTDPNAVEVARRRARIGAMLGSGEHDRAADEYLEMVQRYADRPHTPLTMHRDAQYQIANTLYQRGQRKQASDAYRRLLETYPNDKERLPIRVLLARIQANDLDDAPGAIESLEELLSDQTDTQSRTLIESELEHIRTLIHPKGTQ